MSCRKFIMVVVSCHAMSCLRNYYYYGTIITYASRQADRRTDRQTDSTIFLVFADAMKLVRKFSKYLYSHEHYEFYYFQCSKKENKRQLWIQWAIKLKLLIHVTNYILIIQELSNFQNVLVVVSQTRVSGGNRTHDSTLIV